VLQQLGQERQRGCYEDQGSQRSPGPGPAQRRVEYRDHSSDQQRQKQGAQHHLHFQRLGRVAVLHHALRVPTDQQRFPEADVVLAPRVLGNTLVVEVLDTRFRRKDQAIPLLR